MTLLFRAVLSFVLPVLVGHTLVSTLWPRSPKLLRIALGTGFGLGLAGALWMAGLMVAKTPMGGLIVSESVMALVAAILIWRKRRHAVPAAPVVKTEGPGRIQIAAFAVCVVLSATTAAMMTNLSPHGNYDAAANWNMKARFLFFDERPLEHLDELVLPDYPLLSPSLIARGWQYSGQNTIAIPISLAYFFAVATAVVLMSVLRLMTSGSAALLAGCLVLGTPYWITEAVSQYADIVMCFFITTSVALLAFAIYSEAAPGWLPLLSGLAAGLAGCIKNEGILFIVAMTAVQGIILIRNRGWRTEGSRLVRFTAGLVPGILCLAIFKINAPVPRNAIVANMTFATLVATIGDPTRHFAIIWEFGKRLLFAGQWWINPLLLMILYTVIRRTMMARKDPEGHWIFPALLFGFMACGYHTVYLFSPYEMLWHIDSSFPRLLVQLWPSILLFWTLISTESVEPSA